MDLYFQNTCIEFKTNIVLGGLPISEYASPLDGYLETLLKAGTGVRNGIRTDGVHYFLRRVGPGAFYVLSERSWCTLRSVSPPVLGPARRCCRC